MKTINLRKMFGVAAAALLPLLAACAVEPGDEASAQSAQAVEAQSSTTTPCGGTSGHTCSAGLFCEYANDTCGAGNVSGTCAPIPSLCPYINLPVCGCDGNGYGNACLAERAGVSVSHSGACVDPTAGEACGGWAEVACAAGTFCEFANDSCGAAHASGTCTVEPTFCSELVVPVCGCNGDTYTNECFALRAGVSVAHGGKC